MGGNTIASLLVALGIDATKLQTGLNNAGTTIKSWSSNTTSAMSGVNDKLGIMEKLGTGVHNVLQGIGIAMGFSIWGQWQRVVAATVGLFPDLISKGLAFADTIHKVQVETGASAQSASTFLGIQMYLGNSTDDLGRRIAQLSRNIITHTTILNDLGIKVKDTNGNFLDQITILDNVRSALTKMQDGVTKTAVEVALLGRGGYDMANYFQLTDAQVALLNNEMVTLGVTMDQVAVDKALQAKREMNLFGTAVQGLANQLVADVAPALITAIDAIVKFVHDNGQAIAQFAAQVVNFVLGMITALTGATLQTVSFTQSMVDAAAGVNDANQNIDQYANDITKTSNATAASTKAIDAQIAAITKQIDAVKALETAQQHQYERHMQQVADDLNDTLAALDAKEQAFQNESKRIDLAQQLENDKRTLAMAQAGVSSSGTVGPVDPQAVAQAMIAVQKDLRDIGYQTMKEADDAVRARVKAVQDYNAQIVTDEKDATNKKAFLAQLDSQAKILNSGIAKAKQTGDVNAVADLTAELQAVTTTKTRVQQQIRNGDSQTALEAEKARLEDLKSKIGTVAAAINTIPPTTVTAGKSLLVLTADGSKRMLGMAKNINDLQNPQSLTGALAAAQAAGYNFATDLKTNLEGLIGTIGQVANAFGGLFGPLIDTWNKIPGPVQDIIIGAAAGGKIAGLPGAVIGAIALPGYNEIQSQMNKPENNISIQDYGIATSAYVALKNKLNRMPTETELDQALSEAKIPVFEQAQIRKYWAGLFVEGKASGGWVGLNGPELVMTGERGPEFVVPADKAAGMASGGFGQGGGGTLIIQMGAETIAEIVDKRLAISRNAYAPLTVSTGSMR